MKHVNTGCISLETDKGSARGLPEGKEYSGLQRVVKSACFQPAAVVMGKDEQLFLDWEDKIINIPKSLWKNNNNKAYKNMSSPTDLK